MFQIDLKSRKSIYEQIVNNTKELIIRGVLPADSKLPSVRELSKTLVINPNTAAKAYRQLEAEGYIYTRSGLGSFVSPGSRNVADEEKVREAVKKMKAGIDELRYMGFSEAEIRKKVDGIMTKGGDDDVKSR